MGGGRKTQTFEVGEPSWRSSETPNFSGFRARNLRKSDLGGVIFGCKHNTISECLTKQLFGLPGSHYCYVRNIEPGLPLFLFNYTDRMLHGIYEAAGHGQLNLDPYAWTEDGNERTPFPAQVHICLKTYCQPIAEKIFEPVIKDNYFMGRHFYFELDHTQVKWLRSLFKPTPEVMNVQLPPSSLRSTMNSSAALLRDNGFSNARTWKDAVVNKKESNPPMGVVSENRYASLWEDEDNQSSAMKKTSISDTESGYDQGREAKEPLSDWEDHFSGNSSTSPLDANPGMYSDSQMVAEHKPVENNIEKAKILDKLQKLALANASSSQYSNGHVDVPCVPGESIDCSRPSADIPQNECAAALTCEHAKFQDFPSLVEEMKELKLKARLLEEKQVESQRTIEWLCDMTKNSDKMIQELKEHVKELELKLDPSAVRDECFKESFVEHILGSEKLIYLVGGYDGNSWLNGLDSYSPSLDIVTPLRPMGLPRSYAGVAALDGRLYVFGGGHGSVWYNTVECYDPQNDEWSSCPHLAREKGCLAGATLDGKIFAIGGGDGKNIFSDVEMFDPLLGKWFNSPSMLHKRFAPTAAVHNGSLYAVGGYDGEDYLYSVERYDPREVAWAQLPSMKSKRGSHSLVVFNEKIYAFGGYDGQKMVSYMEVFDPRLGAWTTGEPMNIGRGYASAAVLGESFFVFGGIKDSDNLVDAVECYREGVGWTVTSLKAVGKRCFFSAIVL